MIKNFKIPFIYMKMNDFGLLSKDNYLWLDDMEWISIDQIPNYKYEEDESNYIIPFAHTARFDKWVWVFDENNNDYMVGLCENSEMNGIYYSQNTEDAIIRNIIEYLSSADFYKNKANALSYQKSEIELKSLITNWKNQLSGILCDKYVDLINYFSCLSLKEFSHLHGEWYALLSYEERDELIEKYINFDKINQEFPWFI